MIKRNPTRSVRVGSVTLGSGHPVVVQSMCATKTQDVDATVEQAEAIRLVIEQMESIAPRYAEGMNP